MAQHPDKQAKAQAEIDAVIGSDRLPTVADRPALPYVDALVKEVMRWHPMLPLSTCFQVYCSTTKAHRRFRYRTSCVEG